MPAPKLRAPDADPSVASRRAFLGTVAWAALGCAASPRIKPASLGDPRRAVDEIESRAGGRVGLFALATDSGKTIGHREDERFALCSTFKWVLAAAVLAAVDEKRMGLDKQVAFSSADLVEYSPITAAHVQQGRMTVEALARAAVVTSDNTAANLLLEGIGGPAGLTAFLRARGDGVTRLDRNELALNSNLPGDARDTTSPRAMAGTLGKMLTTGALSPAKQALLIEWMVACETGKARLRAGLPRHWRAGDKSGTGERGAVNDVLIAWPPGRGPILVAAYMSDSASPVDVLNAAHAELGRLVARELGPA